MAKKKKKKKNNRLLYPDWNAKKQTSDRQRKAKRRSDPLEKQRHDASRIYLSTSKRKLGWEETKTKLACERCGTNKNYVERVFRNSDNANTEMNWNNYSWGNLEVRRMFEDLQNNNAEQNTSLDNLQIILKRCSEWSWYNVSWWRAWFE